MCNYFPTIKLKVTPGKSPVVKDNSTCDHCVHPGQAPGGHPGLVILQRISDQYSTIQYSTVTNVTVEMTVVPSPATFLHSPRHQHTLGGPGTWLPRNNSCITSSTEQLPQPGQMSQ